MNSASLRNLAVATIILSSSWSVLLAEQRFSLDELLNPLIKGHDGQVSVWVEHLQQQKKFEHQAHRPMPTASLIKLAVMAEAYRQVSDDKVELDSQITLQAEDKVPGSGVLTNHISPGATFRLRDAIQLMIAYSDNTATNLVIDQIGLASTSRTMAKWGYPQTQLHAKVYRRDTSIAPERSKQFGLGSSTAAETASLLRSIYRKQIVSPEACEAMLEHLRDCQDRTRLTRFLPDGVNAAHKTGAVAASRCDAGILETPSGAILVCVFTTDNKDQSWGEDNAANLLCARIGQTVYDFFHSDDGTLPHQAVVLQAGAGGRLVADLQRTLNQRLKPSPELSVDGDFGPATRAEVERYQREHNLPATGQVTEVMWTKLGALVTQDPPVPEPDVVNATSNPRQPADDAQGPPVVTCKAWALADGKTGALLVGSNENTSLDPASTTKIMTAYVVCNVAEKHPSLLDELVIVSQHADNTPGSTADIRAGETIPVRQLLFGLMLPSGNDASVALGEHVGHKLEPYRQSRAESLARFIQEMNARADALGMQETRYENTHGLTSAGHKTSARDLLTLSFRAMQYPLLREIMNTPKYGYKIRRPGSYERNVVWKNTNRLLSIEGFDGVKTGTTGAAGACLVSHWQLDGVSLMAAVLGSTSSDARYVDSRNLYRWARRHHNELINK